MYKKTNRILIFGLLLSVVAGLVCNYFYNSSPKNAVDITAFQKQLSAKETKAATTMNELKSIIIHSSIDSLIHYPFAKNNISYYVFEKGELAFWSDNNLDISRIALPDSTDWHYMPLPNAHCVSRILTYESTTILALINIKNNYPYENNELINNFSRVATWLIRRRPGRWRSLNAATASRAGIAGLAVHPGEGVSSSGMPKCAVLNLSPLRPPSVSGSKRCTKRA